jgi:hypothetical protein
MDFKRVAATILTIVFALAISPRSAFACEKTDVVVAVHRYYDNLGKDTLESGLAMCDSLVPILDEFRRTSSMARRQVRIGGRRWMRMTRRTGLRTGPPRRAGRGPSTSAEIAYFVAPATYPISNMGNRFTSLAQFSQ